MKLITCLIVATVAAMAAASDVIVLTEANFEAEVKKHDLMLIEFYAPWCGHCKSLEPEYDAAAPILKKNDPPVALAKVDATENGELARRFGVSGYPTLKIFRSGALSGAYEGGRKSADIVAYMKKQTGPSSIEVTSIDQAEAVFAKGDVVVFGLFAQSTDELLSAFNQVADSNRELFTFMHTSEIEVMNKYGFRSNVVVYQPKHLYNKFEEKHAIYQGSPHTKSLEQFIIASGSSLVAHVDTDSQKRFDKKVSQLGLPVVTAYYDVDYRKNPKGTNYWRNRVLKVAQDFKKSFVFGVRNSEEFAREVDEFNLKGKTVGISIKHDGKKYSMKTEFSMDVLRSFLEEYNGGNMKETVKSEAVPETQGDVRVVVGETFKEEVLLNDDDVLIEFYAPWCGHCKKLEPIYNELAAKLKHNSKLRIAKMDATANDFPRSQFAVSGYPTIYFVPGNDKSKALKYEGDRDVAGFTAYLKKNAHHKLTKKKKAKTDL